MNLPIELPLAKRLRWPLPALLTWLAAAAVWAWLQPLGAVPAALAGAAAGAAGAWPVAGRWRRVIVAGGFPLALLALHGAWPAWAWLVPALLVALIYPRRAWGDAPLFPTPADALQGLAQALPLARGARILDAGCGLGHGLAALRREWPEAVLAGIEWSVPLALWTKARCRFADVRQGDMWAADWSAYELVYLFQRPESMARAWAKACADLAPGSWLVSLEFSVPGVVPTLQLSPARGRSVFVYRTIAAPPAPSTKARRSR